MSLEELRKSGYLLTEAQWMKRILFLETIAGVPGFFAAMIRHLKGLRSLVSFSALPLLPSRMIDVCPEAGRWLDSYPARRSGE